jgi:hypothetical protein
VGNTRWPLRRPRRIEHVRRRAGWRLAPLLSLLVTGFGVIVLAPPAHANTPTPVSQAVFDSEAGDWLGQGQSWGGAVTYNGLYAGFPTFQVGSWVVDIAAPAGQQLVPGTYEDAQRAAFRTAGYPGLDVYGDGRGCNIVDGRFVVDEATYDASGNLLSLAVRFEEHCEGATPALFGDLLYNSTAPLWNRTLSGNSLDFTVDHTQTLTITNNGPATDTVQGLSVTGSSAPEFSIEGDPCAAPLGPGADCQITIDFTPDVDDPLPSADLWFNDDLAPLGSTGEPAGAGQGRFIPLSATLPPTLTPSLSSTKVPLGTSVIDTVTLAGNGGGGAPLGTVLFYVCHTGDTQSLVLAACPVTGLPQSTVSASAGEGDASAATSSLFLPPSEGTWCFSTSYEGQTDGNALVYAPASDNTTSQNLDSWECVVVGPPASGPITEPTSTDLAMTESTVIATSEEDQDFTVTVNGVAGAGQPQGTVDVYGAQILLCEADLGGVSSDSANASCGLSPDQLPPTTYAGVYAVFVPDSQSSSSPAYDYAGSSSTPEQTFSVVTTPPVPTPPNGSAPPSSMQPVSAPGTVSSTDGSGYDLVGRDGGVFVFPEGQSGRFYGSLPGLGVHVADVTGMVPSPDDRGYFLVGQDGGVFSFGDAPYLGSLPGLHVSVHDVTGIVPTNDNRGYFLVGGDGGVFTFGDARFLGSLPGKGIHVDDVIGIAATPSDQGYWVVEANGTVFAFGDALDFGSAPGTTSPVAGIASTPDGGGYWIVTQNGGVYPLGDAGSFGSLPKLGVTPAHPVIGLVPTADGQGYWLIGSDGGIFAFGDAPFVGALPDLGVHISDIVGAVPT